MNWRKKMKNIKEINIKIEGQEWEEALDKAFTKANAKAKIDGFRPGKAPKDVFLKKYGKESLYMDAADIVLDKAYHQVFEDNKDLEIVAQPDIALKSIDETGVEFTFTLTLKPEVKLGKYKGLGVKKESIKVTKEEIEHEIEHLRSHYAENVVKDGQVANGDIAIIDFEGFKDGVAFEGGKGENYSLTIGSNTFIPGFEEQLVGMTKGEEKDINVTFPEDYHSEELKGAPVVFKVKVNDIKEVKIPELDKEFFEDLGMEGIDSKESLENQVKENIKAHREAEADNKYIDELLEAASKNVEVEIPEVMISEEQDRILKQYEENLKMQGITLEQFYQFTNSDESALKDQMKDEAVKRVTYRLMLEEIANVEKIEISDEKAEAEADTLAERYQMPKDEFLKAFGGIEMIKYDLKMRAAIDILKGE
ncbi:MAG: trigger factor [Firmicutes bacterium]|nr:trigger factor [Bacillota bacterium]